MTSQRKRRSFSRGSIAQYWCDWQRTNGEPVPWTSHGWDAGEPACMAGGLYLPGWDEAATASARWNSASGLERCHVVPLYAGGRDEVGNLVLLCESCHTHQPNSKDPEVTYAYMRTRTIWDCYGVGGAVAQTFVDVLRGVSDEEIASATTARMRALSGR